MHICLKSINFFFKSKSSGQLSVGSMFCYNGNVNFKNNFFSDMRNANYFYLEFESIIHIYFCGRRRMFFLNVVLMYSN